MTSEATTEVPDLSFRSALSRLDEARLLMKVESEVDPHLELTSILYEQLDRHAVFFKQVSGYGVSVAGNLLASEQNVLTIFQKNVAELRSFIVEGLTSPMSPVTVASGPVQEVRHDDPDLTEHLPLPFYAPKDGGRFISAGVVIACDPDTGVYNASIHRFQHVERNRMLIKIDLGRHLRLLYEKAKERGEALPIAVVMGPDLAMLYAAATMGAQLPYDMDEYHIASGIQRRPLELVQCKTVPLLVPANAEAVLEGYISPDEMVDEGPFMEFIGLYTDVAPAPKVTITSLSHRKKPIWHIIISSEAAMFRKHLLEGAVLKAVKAAAPCVTDVALTAGGLYRFHLIMQVNKRSAADEGLQRNAMFAAIAALKDLDLIIAVDDDIDIRNWRDVDWAMATRLEGSTGIILMPGSRGHEAVIISRDGIRTKVGIDATLPFGFEKRHKRAEIPQADMSRFETSLEPQFQNLAGS